MSGYACCPVTQLISPTILPLIAACDLLGIEEL